MASSKEKEVKAKEQNIKNTQGEMIKAYVSIKHETNGKEMYTIDFVKKTKYTRYQLDKFFRGFRNFSRIGESKYRMSIPASKRALLSENNKKFNLDASKDDCIEDIRKLYKSKMSDDFGEKNIPKTTSLGTISRSYYREHGEYSDATWNRYFGTFQEFKRQAGLELTRHQHKLEKQIAKHSSHDHYRKFIDEELMPYYRKYEKPDSNSNIKNMMIISDLHDKECCEFTLSVFISECKVKQPDIIVLNGDIFDCYEFSKYNKDMRSYDIKGRFEYVWDNVFRPLRKNCPNAQIDMVIGNHEFRLIRLLADVTPNIRILMSDVMGIKLKDVFKLDEYKINLVSKFDLSAFTVKDIRNELNKNYQIYYGCYVVCHEPDKNLMVMSGTNGHHHRLEQVSNAFPDPSTGKIHQVTWVQTPSGHKSDAEYLQNLVKWNTGFLEVIINIKEKEVIQNIHQTCANWTVINGVVYRRKDV